MPRPSLFTVHAQVQLPDPVIAAAAHAGCMANHLLTPCLSNDTCLLALAILLLFSPSAEDVDHPPLLVAPCAPHALDVAQRRGLRVETHHHVHLQGPHHQSVQTKVGWHRCQWQRGLTVQPSCSKQRWLW